MVLQKLDLKCGVHALPSKMVVLDAPAIAFARCFGLRWAMAPIDPEPEVGLDEIRFPAGSILSPS
jgi:hypothetical protein